MFLWVGDGEEPRPEPEELAGQVVHASLRHWLQLPDEGLFAGERQRGQCRRLGRLAGSHPAQAGRAEAPQRRSPAAQPAPRERVCAELASACLDQSLGRLGAAGHHGIEDLGHRQRLAVADVHDRNGGRPGLGVARDRDRPRVAGPGQRWSNSD
jgi:hypothetical protein